MSRAVEVDVDEEIVVEGRSRFSDTVHRPDPDAEEDRPRCTERIASDQEYRRVALELVASHRTLCQNPACFGGERR